MSSEKPRLLAAGADEFQALFRSFQHSVFRLETLQEYRNSGEGAALAAFLYGGPYTESVGKADYTAMVRNAVTVGRMWQRVHVVREPLTDYARFEIAWSYPANVDAGEEVCVIPLRPDNPWPLDLPGFDFWLFDSSTLYKMVYESDGTWLGAQHVTDPQEVVAACRHRDTALHHAVAWSDYIAGHPDLLRDVARRTTHDLKGASDTRPASGESRPLPPGSPAP